MTRSSFFYYSLATVALFVVAMFLGFIPASIYQEEAEAVARDLAQGFGFVNELSLVGIFFFIFLNNAIKALAVIVLGFLFGIFPILFILINGQMIGVIVAVTAQQAGWGVVLAGLLPHGILELPAIIIAASYGIWLGVCMYRRVRFARPFGNSFRHAIGQYFRWVLPLLLAAALIETFITPAIMQLVITLGGE